MAAHWFYKDRLKQIGPLTSSQIRSLSQSGTITPATHVRKEDSEWLPASRIKGLFDERATQKTSDENSVDPLFAMASNAASSVVSVAGTAASAVGGAISGWMVKQDSKNTIRTLPGELSNETQAVWLSMLTRDNQSPDVVKKIADKVNGILMSDEQLTYIAVQNRPIVNWMPDCIALTNKRFIFFRTKILGRIDFDDFVWRELGDAKLVDDVIGSTFSITTAQGRRLSMDYLPKAQARAVYRFAQEMEERSLEQRRNWELEEKRAGAGGVVVQTHIAGARSNPIAEETDPMQILQKLKSLLDAGLITVAEYDAKKTEVLARM